MPWIFSTKTVAITATKSAPDTVDLVLPTGSVKAVSIIMPSTTNDHQAGVRINSPQGLIFPTRAEGSDDWIYSYSTFYKEVFHTVIDLGEVAPVYAKLEAFNTDSATVKVQVGIYIEPFHSEVERMLHGIKVAVEAMKRTEKQPDIEKQVRRLANILFGGGDHGE